MPPLYIRDADVNDLAEEAMRVLEARNKTEAVRQALQSAITASKRSKSLGDRIGAIRESLQKLGPPDPNYDHKQDMDELWRK